MRRHTFIYWLPRIFSILFLCFLTLFSLDVFGMDGTILQKIGGFFIHNVPMLILLGILIVSWKYELVGTTVFFLAAIFYMSMTSGNVNESGMISAWIVIAGPALLISVLFFLSWREKKKKGAKKI